MVLMRAEPALDHRHIGPVERLLDDEESMKRATRLATELSVALRARVGNNMGLGILAVAKLLVAFASIKGNCSECLNDSDAVYHTLMERRRAQVMAPPSASSRRAAH